MQKIKSIELLKIFTTGRIDGMVDVWDIVQDLDKPIYNIKVIHTFKIKHIVIGRSVASLGQSSQSHWIDFSFKIIFLFFPIEDFRRPRFECETPQGWQILNCGDKRWARSSARTEQQSGLHLP